MSSGTSNFLAYVMMSAEKYILAREIFSESAGSRSRFPSYTLLQEGTETVGPIDTDAQVSFIFTA